MVFTFVRHPGEDEWLIFARLLELRPEAWPNCRMVVFADELLGRRGRLTAGRPEMGPYLRKHGRGREVDMATTNKNKMTLLSAEDSA